MIFNYACTILQPCDKPSPEKKAGELQSPVIPHSQLLKFKTTSKTKTKKKKTGYVGPLSLAEERKFTRIAVRKE
jgi:hypothetical protein